MQQKLKIVDVFEAGVKYFIANKFKEAQKYFKEANILYPEDKATLFYLKKCEQVYLPSAFFTETDRQEIFLS